MARRRTPRDDWHSAGMGAPDISVGHSGMQPM